MGAFLLASVWLLFPAISPSSTIDQASAQQEVSPAGAVASPQLGDFGCPVATACILSGCNPLQGPAPGRNTPCNDAGILLSTTKCGWKWCMLLVCPCGPYQLSGYVCKTPPPPGC
jgi:hypothetical protein